MHRKFNDKKLVIASHNQGKVKEIKDLLLPYKIEVVSGGEFNLAEPEETADSFSGNAAIKSKYFAEKTGLPSLSDDSGLVVPALGGAPGIYSARWAGPEKDFLAAMRKVEHALKEIHAGAKDYAAHFVCALSLTWPDMHTEIFEGKVFGKLVFPPRGKQGFGYDPIFIPKNYNITFGEMNPHEKHMISHRANAFNKLIKGCFA